MPTATFRIWRGSNGDGEFRDYTTEISAGMVVLDAVHRIQAEQANDLAVRWNCKAGKCGSCSAEINGNPRLMCMTRLNSLPLEQPVTIEPMKAFPAIKDFVTDVSWNFRVKNTIRKFKPRPPDDAPTEPGAWHSRTSIAFRNSANALSVIYARMCAMCFASTICTNHFVGPRFLVYTAALEMHPLDNENRTADLRHEQGIGYCNITKCCTKVCPEGITITDNAIIPLKERVVDEYFDPLRKLFKIFNK